ncbi:protoporphyrinogen oxidase [Salsuginibacillus kocurii]|uniref:protoporphyrinogen oxidase n=1 Tax=Salsuginibacillus kocurii TaxID=427078 RepID=UPI000361B768
MKIAIIGGGITGLSAAYYLQKELLARGLSGEYKLFEASAQLGGKIQTDYTNGFVLEKGPDSFLARKTSAAKLAKEVGMDDELIYNTKGHAYIYKDQKLHNMPGGAIMGIPTKVAPFATTSLFSPFGKLRAGADVFLPRSQSAKQNEDQSIGAFFRKRLGSEVVDHLIEPLLSGIYAGRIDSLSLQATFPQFAQIEEKHRSLILGMRQTMAERQTATSQEKDSKPKGMFQSLRNGLSSLVESIGNHLDEDALYLEHELEAVTPAEEGSYLLRFANGHEEHFDEIIMTTPHPQIANALPDMKNSQWFKDMPSTSVATVAMALKEEQLPSDLDGTGFLVTKGGGLTITACTYTHKKWEHAAPEGYALLRCYVGRPGEEEIVHESDEAIKQTVLADLNHIVPIHGEPLFTRVTRWTKAMPQYLVGHVQQLAAFREELEARFPGIHVAGASFEGIGLPDCISQGEKAAQVVAERCNTPEEIGAP